LVQAFLKKWWVESDLKVPNLPLSLRLNFVWTDQTWCILFHALIRLYRYICYIKKFIFRYQDLVEIYSVSADVIIIYKKSCARLYSL
jgi:hypothetical protein